MVRPRGRRTIVIGVASVAIHVFLLSALALEVARPISVGSPEPAAIQVTLERLPEPESEKKTVAKPRKAMPGSRQAVREATSPSIVAQTAMPVAPEVDVGAKAEMDNLVHALRASVGCSNPDAVGLSPTEREACRHRFHAGLESAKPVSGLTAEKRAQFDHTARCQETYRAYREASVPPLNGETNGPIPGLGYVPSTRDCAGP